MTRPISRSPSHLAIVAALLALVAIAWLANLRLRGLFIPDEGRYAEIAREMLVSGDWITPRLNDLKYFEKPPLQYWLTAICLQLFGPSNWSARLAPALLGLCCTGMVGLTARRLWGQRTELLAILILASNWAFFLSAEYLTLDMSLSAVLGMALCCYLLARHGSLVPEARAQKKWMWAAWMFIGLAFLTKGLIAFVIPGMALVLYTLWSRDLGLWRQLRLGSGLLIVALLTLPWLVLVQLRNPEFFQFFFIHEQFQRFSSDTHSRLGAWWYYLPILVVGLMPWTPALIAAIGGCFRRKPSTAVLRPAAAAGAGADAGVRAVAGSDARAGSVAASVVGGAGTTGPASRAASDNATAGARFCLCWSVALVVFFSVSHSKLPGYIIPAFPPLALLMAAGLARPKPASLKWCAASLVLCGIAGLFGADRLAHWNKFIEMTHGAASGLTWLWLAMALLVLGGLCALWLIRRALHDRAIVLITLVSLLFWTLMFSFMHEQDVHFSGQRLAARLAAAGVPFYPQAPFFSLGQFDHSLPFYLGRTFTLVDYRGELAPGIDAEPEKVIESVEEFCARWKALTVQAFAVMETQEYQRLRGLGLPMTPVQQDVRLVVVSRWPAPTGAGGGAGAGAETETGAGASAGNSNGNGNDNANRIGVPAR